MKIITSKLENQFDVVIELSHFGHKAILKLNNLTPNDDVKQFFNETFGFISTNRQRDIWTYKVTRTARMTRIAFLNGIDPKIMIGTLGVKMKLFGFIPRTRRI